MAQIPQVIVWVPIGRDQSLGSRFNDAGEGALRTLVGRELDDRIRIKTMLTRHILDRAAHFIGL